MGGGGTPPSGTGGDGGGGMSSSMTDSYNFLRGGWQTNENGIVTFNTIFPGFCKSPTLPLVFVFLTLYRYWSYYSYPYYGASKRFV